MRNPFRFLLILASLALAACYPTTRNPIGASAGKVSEPHLFGAWE